MATFEGRTPGVTFGGLLNIENNNQGIDSTSRPVQDGRGTVGPFEISTTQTKFTQKMLINGQDMILDADQDSKFITSVDDVLTLQLQGQPLFEFDGSVDSAVNGLKFTASAGSAPASINAIGTATNISIKIIPKGTGAVDLGGGLTLAGGSDVIAAYEVGSFTPTLGASVADGNHTYNTQNGDFIRIGNLVWFFVDMNITSVDAAISGSLSVKGLPFQSLTAAMHAVRVLSITYPANTEQLVMVNSSTSPTIAFQGVQSGGGFIPFTDIVLGVTPRITFSGMYRIA